MRRMILCFVVALVAGCAASSRSGAAARRFEPADLTAVRAVLDAQVAAWNRGDLAAYMSGYAKTESLVFTSGAQVRRGWQQTFDAYNARYAQDKSGMGKLAFEIASIDPIGPDGAVVLGAWILTESPHDGRGIFSVILERRPEGWRIVHDHTSSEPPPTPPTQP